MPSELVDMVLDSELESVSQVESEGDPALQLSLSLKLSERPLPHVQFHDATYMFR